MMKRFIYNVLFSLVIFPALLSAATVHLSVKELRRELIISVSMKQGLQDRFQAEIWVAAMENRLKSRVPNLKERLAILYFVHREAIQANLLPALILAMIDVESDFNRFAISEAGARGLMQIMPFWVNEFDYKNDNLFDISTNLHFGCAILRHYLDRENGDLTRALASYNGSLGETWYPDLVYKALRYWR